MFKNNTLNNMSDIEIKITYLRLTNRVGIKVDGMKVGEERLIASLLDKISSICKQPNFRDMIIKKSVEDRNKIITNLQKANMPPPIKQNKLRSIRG